MNIPDAVKRVKRIRPVRKRRLDKCTPVSEGDGYRRGQAGKAQSGLSATDAPPAQESVMQAPQTTPGNPFDLDDDERRPARSGPVFSVLADGTLHMRYTARKRNIEWSTDRLSQEAVAALNAFLGSDSPYIYRATLQNSNDTYLMSVHNGTSSPQRRKERKVFTCFYQIISLRPLRLCGEDGVYGQTLSMCHSS
jgi:hypothetical protein